MTNTWWMLEERRVEVVAATKDTATSQPPNAQYRHLWVSPLFGLSSGRRVKAVSLNELRMYGGLAVLFQLVVTITYPAVLVREVYSKDSRLTPYPIVVWAASGITAGLALLGLALLQPLFLGLHAVVAVAAGAAVGTLQSVLYMLMQDRCQRAQSSFRGCGSCACAALGTCTRAALASSPACAPCAAWPSDACGGAVDGAMAALGPVVLLCIALPAVWSGWVLVRLERERGERADRVAHARAMVSAELPRVQEGQGPGVDPRVLRLMLATLLRHGGRADRKAARECCWALEWDEWAVETGMEAAEAGAEAGAEAVWIAGGAGTVAIPGPIPPAWPATAAPADMTPAPPPSQPAPVPVPPPPRQPQQQQQQQDDAEEVLSMVTKQPSIIKWGSLLKDPESAARPQGGWSRTQSVGSGGGGSGEEDADVGGGGAGRRARPLQTQASGLARSGMGAGAAAVEAGREASATRQRSFTWNRLQLSEDSAAGGVAGTGAGAGAAQGQSPRMSTIVLDPSPRTSSTAPATATATTTAALASPARTPSRLPSRKLSQVAALNPYPTATPSTAAAASSNTPANTSDRPADPGPGPARVGSTTTTSMSSTARPQPAVGGADDDLLPWAPSPSRPSMLRAASGPASGPAPPAPSASGATRTRGLSALSGLSGFREISPVSTPVGNQAAAGPVRTASTSLGAGAGTTLAAEPRASLLAAPVAAAASMALAAAPVAAGLGSVHDPLPPGAVGPSEGEAEVYQPEPSAGSVALRKPRQLRKPRSVREAAVEGGGTSGAE